ncbi:MAG: Sua5/YciO/YrdC/YwlC family protein [Planctomycetes bacterium]|nr:Sua5/YciO/YrdC/YwlC family protein [Planctomycetota bacterium]
MTRAPRTIDVRDEEPSAECVRLARDVLEAGGLAIVPTETVYGLAARADQDAPLAALRARCRRSTAQPFTWHVGDPAALDALAPVSPYVRRIVARYWPGPLTLILPGHGRHPRLEQAGWIGVRCVAHRATAGVLQALPFPVAVTSCDTQGSGPARDAAAALRSVGAAELVLDGGPARLGEPSSVARIGRGELTLLREGLIDLRQLRQAGGLRLGFVCTGNTCRSPMAEGLARAALAERLGTTPGSIEDFGFVVRSMGVHAAEGEPASKHALSVLADHGIDLGGHRARAAQEEDLERYDRLYCMTQGHLDALLAWLPAHRAANAMLLDPNGRNVSDPIGGPREAYRRTAEQIREALEQRALDWA